MLILNRVFWFFCRLAFRLRYRVRVEGGNDLCALTGPTLVLPNHPAYIDPALISSHIRLHRPLRPLVFSKSYRSWLLRPIFALIKAIEVPDLSLHSQDARNQGWTLVDRIAALIDDGECLLIYPSGRIQRGNREIVGATRSAYELVSKRPNVNVVLVRTRGVWGSSFSCAKTGTLPNLTTSCCRGFFWACASLFFFLPKRLVTIRFHVVKGRELPLESRSAFNEFLENWYNADGGEQPVFVRYHSWFGPDQGTFSNSDTRLESTSIVYDAAIVHQVNCIIENHVNRFVSQDVSSARTLNADLLREDTMLESLGLDSLDRMDLSLSVEQQFGHRNKQVPERLGELWALAQGIGTTESISNRLVPDSWFQFRKPDSPVVVVGDSIGEAFLHRAIHHLDEVIVNDRLSGVLTHRRMLIAVRLLARKFEKLSEKQIGIMLPATVAADIVFFALQLANKIPVMLNWTTGPSHLSQVVKQTAIQHVVSARALVNRLGLDLNCVDFIFMEDVKSSISKTMAIRELFATYWNSHASLSEFSPPRPDDIAVLLFTSGSENAPKTVPLTHQNLLVNLRDGLAAFDANSGDSILGFLPPFHSFGLLANVLLTHLSGIRSTRFADPTDTRSLRRLIIDYKPSMICVTPTILGRILSICSPGDLDSLRKIVTGAERCPDAIFQACETIAPRAVILEGYGITECSPVISLNTLAANKRGTVGKPISCVEARVVDVDSGAVVATGKSGMLLVCGSSVFGGYLGYDGPDPFVKLDGKIWYKTGDIVSIDDDGYISICGRVKRFLKAGGEMISLPALEEPFTRLYPTGDEGPKIAVEGIETESSRHIVLFSTEAISLDEVSKITSDAGLRGVMRIDEVRRLDSIPVLGTGKVDYKQLRKMIESS